MANWPSTLPQLPTPLSILPQDGAIRTTMDTGPDKVRRRFSATTHQMSFSQVYTGAQWDTLMSFYNANLSFTMQDPESGSQRTFRFVQPPSGQFIVGAPNRADRQIRVSITIERLP